MRQIMFRTFLVSAVATAGGGYFIRRQHKKSMFPKNKTYHLPANGSSVVPPRDEMINRMKVERFDIIIIGGGATGAGVALDCATRGLKCALLEGDDFSSGTSSRSTKLLHGGVRYLEAAFKQLDISQLSLVWEALEERAHAIKSASHMAHAKAIVMPLYQFWQVPYCWLGVKVYDWMAKLATCFDTAVPNCFYLSPSNSRYFFPLLQPNKLKGSLVYFDGMHNDSRMNLMIALTSAIPNYVEGMQPAAIANHCRVVKLLKDKDGKLLGVGVVDKDTGKYFEVFGKAIINCTGPASDTIRSMANAEAESLVSCAAGAHIVLPKSYCPSLGMIIPKTSSGSVLFLLPWEDSTIVGTTDTKASFVETPTATTKDVDFIVSEAVKYLKVDESLLRRDIRAVWSGLRPLARQASPTGEASSTVKLSRSHQIVMDPKSRLVSVMGGKWTTYRRMAQDAVDFVLGEPSFELNVRRPCITKQMKLFSAVSPSGNDKPDDADYFGGMLPNKLASEYKIPIETAAHLVRNYGFQARGLCEVGSKSGSLTPLIDPQFPFVKAEVVWAIRNELALTLSDVLGRRLRIGFLDSGSAMKVVEEVADIFAKELSWPEDKKSQEINAAISFISSFGVPGVTPIATISPVAIPFESNNRPQKNNLVRNNNPNFVENDGNPVVMMNPTVHNGNGADIKSTTPDSPHKTVSVDTALKES